MNTIDPIQMRAVALKYGCTFPPPSVLPPVKHASKSPNRPKRKSPGKNIKVVRDWIQNRKSPFSYVVVANETGLKPDAVKYCLWRIALEGEIEAVPRGKFENQNSPRRYQKL